MNSILQILKAETTRKQNRNKRNNNDDVAHGTTAASSIEGWVRRIASISAGATYKAKNLAELG